MSRMEVVRRLYGLMAPVRRHMAGSVAARTVRLVAEAGMVATGVTIAVRLATGEALRGQVPAVALLASLALAKGIARYVEQYLGHYVAFKLLASLRTHFYYAVARAFSGLDRTETSGNLTSRVMGDVDRIEAFYAHTVAPVAAAFLAPPIVLLGIAVFADPLLAWALLPAFVVVGAVVPLLANRSAAGLASVNRAEAGNVATSLVDSIHGVHDVLTFEQDEARQEHLDARAAKADRSAVALARLNGIRDGVNAAVIAAALLATTILGVQLLNDGIIEPVQVAAVILVALIAFDPLKDVQEVLPSTDLSLASARRLFAIADRVPERMNEKAPVRRSGEAPGLAFENVSFSYHDGDARPVIEDVSFHIDEGEVVALVGPSGSGKSTIVDLALGLQRPTAGRVVVGGDDIADLEQAEISKRIAAATQGAHVFNESVADNLRVARPDAGLNELRTACVGAAVDGDVLGFRDGYESQVGDLGALLSGGQRQRLSLARALLADTPFLILDEATSEIDRSTEERIWSNLERLEPTRTILVVTHRLEVAAQADRILVLHGGTIVEAGTDRDLRARGGVYAGMTSERDDLVPWM